MEVFIKVIRSLDSALCNCCVSAKIVIPVNANCTKLLSNLRKEETLKAKVF